MEKKGVSGIGRIFTYSFNLRTCKIFSYTLQEGQLHRGQLHGFGRSINCYNKTHELTLGFWELGQLEEERPWKREEIETEETKTK